ncbi:hypothetical protein F5B18DRAFT_363530 [Nemania serpens]|nr:hypothetical protein F5B18DRAFT_363530 [Nemania serpens]
MAEVAPAMLPDENLRKSSKHRDDATTGKKRQRESNQTEKAERRHKKSRKDAAAPELTQAAEAADGDEAPKQKRRGHKSSKVRESETVNGAQSQYETTSTADADENAGDDGGKRSERKKKHKKESKEAKQPKESKESKKSKKKSREAQEQTLDDDDPFTQEHPDVVVLASSRTKKPLGTPPSKHLYPFYTQTVSQYLPLHPLGINEPIDGYMNQHLEPLLNRYVPIFSGVLLACRSPRIGEAPGSSSLSQDGGIEDAAMLESINEYAVSFGWLTVEIDVFRPSRGAWLEGLVNIQSGGHIGVVCWGKFNASIEAERLPRDWQWVDQHPSSSEMDEADPENPSSEESPDVDDDNNNNNNEAAEQTEVHATGYWVDGEGAKIPADKPIWFRIKNYEVGTSGDYGYLSIEGTMLGEKEEEEKVRKEMEVLRGKAKPGSALQRRHRGPLPELGITKFTNDDLAEPGSQPTAAA